jgi:hypothetical protein
MHPKRLAAALLPILALGAVTPEPPKPRYAEIDGRGEVMTAPRPVTAKGRKVLEFEIEMASYLLAREQPRAADKRTVVDMTGLVRVVHDPACGGEPALSVGDEVDFRGEYVEVPDGVDLVRFTHAPGGPGCGPKDHPAGYLREVVPPAPTAPATPPKPSDIVPDQPYRGTPVPSEKAYLEILRLKQGGASDETLLERIRSEKKAYPMTLAEIQTLKDAGVSPAVLEAMLKSGRRTVGPGPTPTSAPRGRGSS